MVSLAALVMFAAVPSEGRGDVYAIIVGHNGGLSEGTSRALPTLKFADDDALRLARWFEPLATPGGVFVLTVPDADTVTTLAAAGVPIPQTRAPTRRALTQTFEALRAKLANRSGRATVFFFYAGHGLTGRLLLEPEGGDVASVTGRELKLSLADVGADHVELFIDACRSQSLFTERGPDLSSDISELEAKASATVFGVLTAAQSDTPAGEASDLRGGFFSHVLASGLAGAADADGDDVVRFGELAAFVAFNTQGLTGQRPWFEPPRGDLTTPVIQLAGTTRLALSEETMGRLRVTSEKGLPVVAELFKPKGRRMALTLPSGRYVVERRDGPEQAANVELTAGETSLMGELLASQRTRAEARGELSWEPVSFQAAFSTQVVAALDAGYVSGRPSPTTSSRRFALGAAYLVSTAPFGLVGVEHGAEVQAQWQLGGVTLGARVAFRTSQANSAALHRVAVNVWGGWRFRFFSDRLDVTPFAQLGTKTIWRNSGGRVTGDAVAPSVGGGLHLEWRALSWLSLWLDGRGDVSFIALDGVRSPFAEPNLVVGANAWLF